MIHQLKVRTQDILQKLGRAHLVDVAQMSSVTAAEDDLRRLAEAECRHEDPPARERILTEIFHYGPLDELFKDPTITEVIVNGADCIWIEKQGHLQRHSDCFLTETTYRNAIWRICREANIQFSLNQPFADGSWRCYRVHIASQPISNQTIVLSLRRHPTNPWTLSRLLENGWAQPHHVEALKELVEEKQNFLIVGGTGSGKTSVLNACLQEIPVHERVVTIEDTDELRLPNTASTKLLTRHDPHQILRDIGQSELVRQSLRMRPDRIVMGEIRGGEAQDLLMAFATGHRGCMGTLHADSARQALIRLEMLVQMGVAPWNLQAVRTLILLSVQAIVVVRRTEDGRRTLEGLYKVCALEDCGFLLEPISKPLLNSTRKAGA